MEKVISQLLIPQDKDVIRLINAWAQPYPHPDYSPFLSDDEWSPQEAGFLVDWDKKIEDWAVHASREQLHTLLGFLISPPAIAPYHDLATQAWGENFADQEFWEECMVGALAEWGRQDPDYVVPLFGEALTESQDRSRLLQVVASIYDRSNRPIKVSCLPWLKPLVGQAEMLSEHELKPLISALYRAEGEEARELLTELKKSLPPTMAHLRKQIDAGLEFHAAQYQASGT